MATVALQSAARGSGAAGTARGERPHGTELPKFRLSPKVPPEPSRAAPRAPSPGPTAAHGGPLFSPGRAGLRAAGILPPPRQRVVRPPKPQVCAVAPALSTDVQLRAPHCERDPPPAWGKDLKRKKKKKKGREKTPTTLQKLPTSSLPPPLGCTFLPARPEALRASLTAHPLVQTSPAPRALCSAVPRAALPPPRALPSRSAASPCGRTRGPPSRAPAPPLLSAPAALRTRRSHGSILNNRALSFARPIVLLREKGAREAWDGGGVAHRDGGGDFTHARTRPAPPAPPPAPGGRGPTPASPRRGGASAPLPARPRSAAR